ncbi:hypothetical protein AX17_006052 [Amanita inopinata Kibby_2008]|nr:hypothetical protein AX17_006052 [Amanita inopinata Kibby_2008]
MYTGVLTRSRARKQLFLPSVVLDNSANAAIMVSPSATGKGIHKRWMYLKVPLTVRQIVPTGCDYRRAIQPVAVLIKQETPSDDDLLRGQDIDHVDQPEVQLANAPLTSQEPQSGDAPPNGQYIGHIYHPVAQPADSPFIKQEPQSDDALLHAQDIGQVYQPGAQPAAAPLIGQEPQSGDGLLHGQDIGQPEAQPATAPLISQEPQSGGAPPHGQDTGSGSQAKSQKTSIGIPCIQEHEIRETERVQWEKMLASRRIGRRVTRSWRHNSGDAPEAACSPRKSQERDDDGDVIMQYDFSKEDREASEEAGSVWTVSSEPTPEPPSREESPVPQRSGSCDTEVWDGKPGQFTTLPDIPDHYSDPKLNRGRTVECDDDGNEK